MNGNPRVASGLGGAVGVASRGGADDFFAGSVSWSRRYLTSTSTTSTVSGLRPVEVRALPHPRERRPRGAPRALPSNRCTNSSGAAGLRVRLGEGIQGVMLRLSPCSHAACAPLARRADAPRQVLKGREEPPPSPDRSGASRTASALLLGARQRRCASPCPPSVRPACLHAIVAAHVGLPSVCPCVPSFDGGAHALVRPGDGRGMASGGGRGPSPRVERVARR